MALLPLQGAESSRQTTDCCDKGRCSASGEVSPRSEAPWQRAPASSPPVPEGEPGGSSRRGFDFWEALQAARCPLGDRTGGLQYFFSIPDKSKSSMSSHSSSMAMRGAAAGRGAGAPHSPSLTLLLPEAAGPLDASRGLASAGPGRRPRPLDTAGKLSWIGVLLSLEAGRDEASAAREVLTSFSRKAEVAGRPRGSLGRAPAGEVFLKVKPLERDEPPR